MPLVLLAGVPSVGKSTVLAEAIAGSDWRTVNIGTSLYELARERGLVGERDGLRELPPAILAGLRVEVARGVKRDAAVIVDTHITIRGRAGFVCFLSDGVLQALRPDGIVLVESDPRLVVERRMRDLTRRRDDDDEREVADHQSHNRSAAWAIAATREIPVVVLRNDQAASATAKQLRVAIDAMAAAAISR